MEPFSTFLNLFSLIAHGVIVTRFISALTGKKPTAKLFAAYSSLLFALSYLIPPFDLPELCAIGLHAIVLYGIVHFLMQNHPTISWVASVLTVSISQLSFGIVNSVQAILCPHWVNAPHLYLAHILASLSSFVICVFCYTAVSKILFFKEDIQPPYLCLFLFPELFFFAAEQYILYTSYRTIPAALSFSELGKHAGLLLIQVLGIVALLCTSYAYQRICRNFHIQSELISVTQAAQAQKIYISEAKMRYEQTRSFRHDIKNHLSILDALLKNGQLEESRAYLKKLETASTALSFPYQTGNAVVDILLCEKLGIAKANGINTEVSLLLPHTCEIDDFDLCILFANALDNAVAECQSIKEEPFLSIRGEQQGDFYLLEFYNTCSADPMPPMGIGLSNIKSVAEKYHGAMSAKKNDTQFCLNILLNIS